MNALNEPRPAATEAAPEGEEEAVLDIRELLAVLLGSWPLIVACALIAFGIGRYLVFVSTPVYETDALVQVETMPNAAQVAVGQITQNVAPGLPRETEIALLRSRNVLGTVVDRLGLDIRATPHRLVLLGQPLGAAVARHHSGDGFGQPPAWLAPFAEADQAWGGEAIDVTTFRVPESLVGQRFQVIKAADDRYELHWRGSRLATGRVGEALRVDSSRLAGSDFTAGIELFVQRLDAAPGTAFDLTKLPREAAIASLQRGFSTRAGSAPGILTLRYTGESPQDIARILTVILQTYQAQNIERRSEQAEQTLSFLTSQLPELRERVETAEARLNQFRIDHGTADLDQETAAILDRSLALEQERTQLVQRREEALQRFTTAHPVVVSLDSQIQRIESLLAEVNERVTELPDIQQQALALQREVQLATTLYTALLNRRQEIEMVRAGTTGSIRIIDTPVVPKRAIAPNSFRTTALATSGGIALGLGLVFAIFLLRTGVDDPAKVEKRLGLPTYGSVPWSSLQQRLAQRIQRMQGTSREKLLAEVEPNSTTIEAIRSLRTALRFAQFDAPDNITMLTSPIPGAGKSFISINLGAMMASAGERVVVVDADMRRGYLNKIVGFDRSPGLSELISATASLDDVVKKTDINGLYLLPTGTLPPNPSEMVMTEEFLQVLQTLSSHFDQVIIDTPPILAVTEAADIGRHCGTTLLVLKAGAHPMRMIEDTVTRLRRSGVRVRGTVFNQVGRNRSTYYGYGYGYYGGYYSGYRYSYDGGSKSRLKPLLRTVKRRLSELRRRSV